MPPRNGNRHVGAAAKQVAEHASALTRLELELATLELKKKAIREAKLTTEAIKR